MFRRARVVGSASKSDTDKPVAVFLGKARLGDPQSAGVRGRIAIHDRHIRSIWVKTGPVRVERLGDCVHISLPALRPPVLGGLLFYSVGPLIAVIAAVVGVPAQSCARVRSRASEPSSPYASCLGRGVLQSR